MKLRTPTLESMLVFSALCGALVIRSWELMALFAAACALYGFVKFLDRKRMDGIARLEARLLELETTVDALVTKKSFGTGSR